MKNRISDIIDKSKKKIPEANIQSGSSSSLVIPWITTSIPVLDNILGGGLPRGKMILLVGPYGVGKTFLSYVWARDIQKQGGVAAYLDIEGGFDPIWVSNIGVNIDDLLVVTPSSGEAAFDTVMFLITEGVDIIIVDSVAAMTSAAETDAADGMDYNPIGIQARMNAVGLRRVRKVLNSKAMQDGPETNPVFVTINQIRSGIGGPVPFETYPGGKAQGHFAHIILRLSRGGSHIDGKEVGFNIVARTKKNKLHQEELKCEIPFKFTGEVDVMAGLVDMALNAGVIDSKGAGFYIYKGEKIRGKLALLSYVKENDLYEELREAVNNSNIIMEADNDKED